MGVLVFIMAVLPLSGSSNMHLMRAESPGPSVGKLTPRLGETAKALYLIYIALTVSCCVFLLLGGMPLFDSVCTAFGTAATMGVICMSIAQAMGLSPVLAGGAVLSGVAGLMTSYYWGTSAGASITLYLALFFLGTFFCKK